MAKSDIEIGPTGKTVSENVKRLYKAQGMNLNQLSERTEKEGRKLSVSALSLIATEKRRVDVDDLMTLAAALEVSPTELLGVGDIDLAQKIKTIEAQLTEVKIGLTAAGEVGHGND
jgi:transcriptional regulator with XRE-family HTH domain